MRFCPFCSAENADGATHCAACARKLPPLPARKRTEGVDGGRSAIQTRSATETPLPVPRRATSTPPPAPHSRPATQAPSPRAERVPAADLPRAAPSEPPARTTRDARGEVSLGSALDSVTLGPTTRRREREPEPPRPTGAPARRATDAVDDEWGDEWGDESPTRLSSEPSPDSSPERSRLESEPPPLPMLRAPTLPEPPPTRVTVSSDAIAFKPPKLDPVPEVPEGGMWNAGVYAVLFLKARWQRRAAIRALESDIRSETTSLDQVLGLLGKQARSMQIDNRVLSGENAAIDAAEQRKRDCEQAAAELDNRQAEENAKFAEISSEREAKVAEAEEALATAENEHGSLEAQRRSLREKRKNVERQQKSYLKAAEDREEQAGKAQLGDERMALRKAAEDMRRDAAALDPERQDLERRLAALEKPISRALAKVEALKQELEATRRSLNDAREGHRHRLAEIEAEQGRKSRELAQADAEVQRRLVTLGTLVNLHRIDSEEFSELYQRVDSLRGAIGAQSTEIDKLTAEREAYDKASLVRGAVALGGGVVIVITLIVILIALL